MTTLDPFARALAKVKEPDYRTDVAAWAWRKLEITMWSKPVEIAQATLEHKRVAVPACHSSSKSHSAGLLACHHIDTHVAGEARVVTTAPSQPQVAGVLWGEINKMWERARDVARARGDGSVGLPGRVNQLNWHIGRWQAGIGRKPSDYKPEQFAGFHALHPFIILDEADGLPETMWDGVEALMTSRFAKMLAIANPLDPNSRFARVLEQPDWHVIRIPYDTTPNFTEEAVPQLLRDVLIDPEWVEGRRLEWGGKRAVEDPTFTPDHPFWWGRVLALHPTQAQFSIMRVHDVEACREPSGDEVRGLRQLGVDIAASEKGDKTVARERVGKHALRRWELQEADDDKIIDWIVDKAKEVQAEVVCFDGTGMGTFVPGRLRAKLPNTAVVAVNFAAHSDLRHDDGSRKFANLRAELWLRGKFLSENRDWDLSRAEGAEGLVYELVAPRYRPDVLAKDRVYQVESKDEVRKRIGRSPDDADATLLAFHQAKASGPATISSARGYTIPTGAASVVRVR